MYLQIACKYLQTAFTDSSGVHLEFKAYWLFTIDFAANAFSSHRPGTRNHLNQSPASIATALYTVPNLLFGSGMYPLNVSVPVASVSASCLHLKINKPSGPHLRTKAISIS
jgi:hypothetical protein